MFHVFQKLPKLDYCLKLGFLDVQYNFIKYYIGNIHFPSLNFSYRKNNQCIF